MSPSILSSHALQAAGTLQASQPSEEEVRDFVAEWRGRGFDPPLETLSRQRLLAAYLQLQGREEFKQVNAPEASDADFNAFHTGLCRLLRGMSAWWSELTSRINLTCGTLVTLPFICCRVFLLLLLLLLLLLFLVVLLRLTCVLLRSGRLCVCLLGYFHVCNTATKYLPVFERILLLRMSLAWFLPAFISSLLLIIYV